MEVVSNTPQPLDSHPDMTAGLKDTRNRKISPLPEFETWTVQARSLVLYRLWYSRSFIMKILHL